MDDRQSFNSVGLSMTSVYSTMVTRLKLVNEV